MVTVGVALGGAGTASAHTPGTAPAQTAESPVQRATLVGADSDDGDRFGWSMATDGETVLIGAVTDEDPNGEQAGAVYVFERDGDNWTQTAKLAPDDGDASDLFGSSLAIDGDLALVGARQDEDPASAGSIYVFERTDGGWEQATKLVPETITARALLGWSVALAGETVLAGAPRTSLEDSGSGAVFAFERADGGWEQQATLAPGDASDGALFGTAVATSGDLVSIGAPGTAEPNGEQAGAVYVFERDGGNWTQTAKLVPDDGDASDLFGNALAVDGTTALVPAVGDEDPNGDGAGSAYVFERDGGNWTRTAKLAPDDGQEGDEFGWSVTFDGEIALVGARRTDDPNGENGGAAYLFGHDGGEWTQRAKIAPANATEGARAGSSVALAGTEAFLGAPNDTTATESGDVESGSVSVFDLTGKNTPSPTASPTPTPRRISTPTPTPTPGETGPGFGAVAALSGLAGWLWWRHSR